jgi:hypothetical protein
MLEIGTHAVSIFLRFSLRSSEYARAYFATIHVSVML